MDRVIKTEHINGYKVEYYKGTNKHKYKAVLYKDGQKVKTVQFGHIDYKNGKNSIEPGKYEWPTKEENMEHRKRYRQRHAKEKDTFPSAGFFAFNRLW